jgi:hypothetical protein
MSRFVRSLAGAVALSTAIVHSLAAQSLAPLAVRPLDGSRADRRADVGGALFGIADATPFAQTGAPVAPTLAGGPIDARRSPFIKAGAITGIAAATVWAYQSGNRKDGFGFLVWPVVLPLIAIPSSLLGGAVGYGVSFLVYPAVRTNRAML